MTPRPLTAEEWAIVREGVRWCRSINDAIRVSLAAVESATDTDAYVAAWQTLLDARKAAGLDDGPAPLPDATGYPV
jgi:hypothetical protein